MAICTYQNGRGDKDDKKHDEGTVDYKARDH